MTTLSYHQHGHHQPARLPVYSLPQRVTQGRVIAAEWIKLRTQQSALWAGAGAIGLTAGFGILYAALLAARPPHGAAAAFDPTAVSLSGIQLAQIAVGVLGAMLITSEYGSGMIRATFAAVPRRLPVLWGKAAVALAAVFAASVPAVLIAFFAGQSVLAKVGLDTSFGQPGVARAVLGSAAYLAVAAVLGLGLGALLRNTAAAVTALFGLLFGLQLLAGLIPGATGVTLEKFMPSTAGQAIASVHPDPGTSLGPWAGLGLFAGYTVIVLALAARRMSRGDA
ncbi:MAG TPA: ABC transporter permease [Streptosporangiaceae bacterium]|nr:ABC transporter permease [Streptosporangiaceae bacterium]